MLDEYGNWKSEKTFDTEAEAVAYINGKSEIMPQSRKPVSNLTSGTYEGEQIVTLTAGDGEIIYYTTNGITPSEITGTVYSTAVTIDESCALKAISTKVGQSKSEVSVYEYIIIEE